VGGRETQRAPKLLAVRNPGLDREAIAEQARGLGYLAILEQLPDTARRHDLVALVAERLDDADAEAEVLARLGQEAGVASAVPAEVKIETGDGVADGKPVMQDQAHEIVGARLRQRAVERQFDHGVEAQ